MLSYLHHRLLVRLFVRAILGMAVTTSVGAQVTVSAGGHPNYNYPIVVPPGIAGMEPKLSIHYDGSNGVLGSGWSVQGISMITRCPAERSIDGRNRAVDYGADDKLCLDGQRLIRVDPGTGATTTGIGTNDAAGLSSGYREFRTEKDTFARIRAYGLATSDAADGPGYFKVWHKSGLVYEYGASPSASATTAALVTAQGSGKPIVWAAARASDVLGNYIDFKYEQLLTAWGSGPTAGSSTAGREWNIREIQYAGHGTQLPANKVVFYYGDRITGKSEAYHQGSKTVQTRQLNEIRTYINSPNATSLGPASTAVLTRSYGFAYTVSAATSKLLLASVTECVDAASPKRCLPPTQFTYTAGAKDSFQSLSNFSLKTLGMYERDNESGALTGDFNGDGRTDLIRWSDDPAQNKLYLSQGDGTFQLSTAFNLTSASLFKSNDCYSAHVADFNGDAIVDILRYGACSGSHFLYLSKGDGSFTSVALSAGFLKKKVPASSCVNGPLYEGECIDERITEGANFYLTDVDADGLLDVIQTVIPEHLPTNLTPCAGQSCTRVYKGNGLGGFVEIPTSLASTPVYSKPGSRSELTGASHLVDIDGDGLDDLVRVGDDRNQDRAYRSLGNGNFKQASLPDKCTNPLDFNGDGKADCLVTGSTNKLLVALGNDEFATVADFNHKSNEPLFQAIPLDVNGDGRTDLLRWNNDPTKNVVLISDGNGKFQFSETFNLDGSTDRLRSDDAIYDFIAGDFTGRGSLELLRRVVTPNAADPNRQNRLYQKTVTQPADLLASVTSSTGATSSLTYVPLSNPDDGLSIGARYVSDKGVVGKQAVPPRIDVTSPMYVVATLSADSGVGATKAKTEYAYRGLKADPVGQGLLGFRETRQQSTAPNGDAVTVVTRHLQTEPYIGLPARTETRLGAISAITGDQTGPLLSSSYSIYCDTTSTVDPDAATEATPCAVTSKIQRPYMRKLVERSNDLDGSTRITETTTTNTYNAAGDPTQIVTQTSGTVAGSTETTIKTTVNSYFADTISDTAWIRGRLKQATVTSKVSNALPSTAAGTAVNATAVSGPQEQAPLAGFLTVITTMLLED